MTGEQRRLKIRQMLLDAQQPMTGTALAKGLHVSRQVIVQDIALMRAENMAILSTNKGYLLRPDAVRSSQPKRVFFVRHTTEQVLEEFIDAGALVTVRDLWGRTVFHYAAINEDPAIYEWLKAQEEFKFLDTEDEYKHDAEYYRQHSEDF